MSPQPLLISSEIYRKSSYGPRHPLSVQRVPAALDLIRAMGWLDEARYVDSPRATPAQLARFHDPGYIAALQAAESHGADPETCRRAARERFEVGRMCRQYLALYRAIVGVEAELTCREGAPCPSG